MGLFFFWGGLLVIDIIILKDQTVALLAALHCASLEVVLLLELAEASTVPKAVLQRATNSVLLLGRLFSDLCLILGWNKMFITH